VISYVLIKGLLVVIVSTVIATTQHYDHGISLAGKPLPIPELENSSFVPVQVLEVR
jgi:hypothetical protein